MKRATSILTGLVIFLFLTIGCNKTQPLTVNLLSGTYIVKYSHGTETLVLQPDGSYTQRYVSKSNKEPTLNHGKWTLDFIRGANYVTLDEALRFDTGKDQPCVPPDRTMWSLPADGPAGSYCCSIPTAH